MDARPLLESLESDGIDPLQPALAYLAGRSVGIADADLNAARRRALLLLAAGGDPHRDLGVDDPAVRSLAADLDAPERRESLVRALRDLRARSEGLLRVSGALDALLVEHDLAWTWLACAFLAEELADSDF